MSDDQFIENLRKANPKLLADAKATLKMSASSLEHQLRLAFLAGRAAALEDLKPHRMPSVFEQIFGR